MRTVQRPGGNPNAPGSVVFGVQGGPDAIELDSNGDAAFLGNVVITGSVSAGSGLGSPSNPYGLAAQTFPYNLLNTSFSLSSGLLVFMEAYLSDPISILGIALQSAGATSTGSNRLGIYTDAGVLIDTTVDMTAVMSGAAPANVEGALSAGTFTPTPGTYYLGALFHFTSAPVVFAYSNSNNVPPINGHYPTIFFGGQTSMPASFTPSAGSLNSGSYFIYGR